MLCLILSFRYWRFGLFLTNNKSSRKFTSLDVRDCKVRVLLTKHGSFCKFTLKKPSLNSNYDKGSNDNSQYQMFVIAICAHTVFFRPISFLSETLSGTDQNLVGLWLVKTFLVPCHCIRDVFHEYWFCLNNYFLWVLFSPRMPHA